MSDGKRIQNTPAWLLVADRYLAEITEAERLEAMTVAEEARRTARARRSALVLSQSHYPRHVTSILIVQARARARTRDLTSPPAVH